MGIASSARVPSLGRGTVSRLAISSCTGPLTCTESITYLKREQGPIGHRNTWRLSDELLPHLGLTFDLTVKCNMFEVKTYVGWEIIVEEYERPTGVFAATKWSKSIGRKT